VKIKAATLSDKKDYIPDRSPNGYTAERIPILYSLWISTINILGEIKQIISTSHLNNF
jgi:hypothetical protein